MGIYRPFVEAVQWTGTNITEVRQFVRANQGYFNEVAIRDGVLYLRTATPDPMAGSREIAVPVTNWVVRGGENVDTDTAAVFVASYTEQL